MLLHLWQAIIRQRLSSLIYQDRLIIRNKKKSIGKMRRAHSWSNIMHFSPLHLVPMILISSEICQLRHLGTRSLWAGRLLRRAWWAGGSEIASARLKLGGLLLGIFTSTAVRAWEWGSQSWGCCLLRCWNTVRGFWISLFYGLSLLISEVHPEAFILRRWSHKRYEGKSPKVQKTV